jgi:hypothetical protein
MAEFKLGRLRFVWKGTWATGTAYVKDDIVKYGGASYVCVSGHTANANFNVYILALKWQTMTSGQEWRTDPWATSTDYKLGDLVKYGGRVYVCTANHTSSVTSVGGFYDDENLNYWDLFVDGTEWKNEWTPSTYYKIGDLVRYNGLNYICINPHLSAAETSLGLEVDLGADSSTAKWDIFTEGFKWRGDWNGSQDPLLRVSTRYMINDVVKFGASLYLCVEAHTSNSTAFDELKWSLFVAGLEYEDSWNAIEDAILNAISDESTSWYEPS